MENKILEFFILQDLIDCGVSRNGWERIRSVMAIPPAAL
jgi:hypothetical protein